MHDHPETRVRGAALGGLADAIDALVRVRLRGEWQYGSVDGLQVGSITLVGDSGVRIGGSFWLLASPVAMLPMEADLTLEPAATSVIRLAGPGGLYPADASERLRLRALGQLEWRCEHELRLPDVRLAESGTARIAYDVTGDGPDVLLIHAGVNDRRSWHHVVDRLSPDHRCVAFDMRGFGDTEYEPEDGWSRVADALAVMDAAGARRPVVVGCSMGGKTAIDLALAHPDRVAGLVLIGTAIRGAPYPQEGSTADLEAKMEAADEAGDLEEVNRLDAWMWLDGPSAEEGRVTGATRELFLDMNGRALRAHDPGEEAEPPDAWPRLEEIAVPTLMLLGRLDVPELNEVDEQGAARIPGCRLEWLEGVAHVPHLEGDAATLDAIASFAAAHGVR